MASTRSSASCTARLPDWCSFPPKAPETVRIVATDTGDSWHVTLGQANGVDPDDGEVIDERVSSGWPASTKGQPAAATITRNRRRPRLLALATPDDRPVTPLRRPRTSSARFESAIAPGID